MTYRHMRDDTSQPIFSRVGAFNALREHFLVFRYEAARK